MRTLALAFALALFIPSIATSQEACPCVPLSYQWIATPCETWNCAASAAIMANGDKYVLAMPTGADDFKWVVLKRVVAGSVIVSPDAPFKIDSFDRMDSASSNFALMGKDQQAMLLTVPDGKVVIISRNLDVAARKRSVGH